MSAVILYDPSLIRQINFVLFWLARVLSTSCFASTSDLIEPHAQLKKTSAALGDPL